jgi:hypothetical protein
VEVGVVRNAVPNIDMSEFKRELVHATKLVANELNDKQSRVTVRYFILYFLIFYILLYQYNFQFYIIFLIWSMNISLLHEFFITFY